MRFAIVTFGCRVNQADSLHIEEDLRRRGGEPSSAATADVVIVNTCSVTASADQGARQVVRRIARENPSARIVATGCYATRRPEDLESLPNVVRVVRNDDKLRIGGLPELTTAARFARRGRALRRTARARDCRADGIHAEGADRLRPGVCLLHHPVDPGAVPQPSTGGDRGGSSPRHLRGLQGDRAHRRPPRLVRTRSLAGVIAPRPPPGPAARGARRHLPHQFPRTDGLRPRDRGPRRGERRRLRAALSPAAAARQ